MQCSQNMNKSYGWENKQANESIDKYTLQSPISAEETYASEACQRNERDRHFWFGPPQQPLSWAINNPSKWRIMCL